MQTLVDKYGFFTIHKERARSEKKWSAAIKLKDLFFATEPTVYLMENMKIHGDIEPFDDQSRNAMTFEWRMAVRSTSALGINRNMLVLSKRTWSLSLFSSFSIKLWIYIKVFFVNAWCKNIRMNLIWHF